MKEISKGALLPDMPILDINLCTKVRYNDFITNISTLQWEKFPTRFYFKNGERYTEFSYEYSHKCDGDLVGIHYYDYRNKIGLLIIND